MTTLAPVTTPAHSSIETPREKGLCPVCGGRVWVVVSGGSLRIQTHERPVAGIPSYNWDLCPTEGVDGDLALERMAESWKGARSFRRSEVTKAEKAVARAQAKVAEVQAEMDALQARREALRALATK